MGKYPFDNICIAIKKSICPFLPPRSMRVLALAPLILCPLLAASERRPVESSYDRHVVFDQNVPARSYSLSEGTVTAPSAFDLVNGRIPLDSGHFVVPPTSLRLTWKSATGGDWQAKLKTRSRYGLLNDFDGDTITFWCLSPTGLAPDDAPRIRLEDADGAATFTINMLSGRGALQAGQWAQVRLPIANFRAIYRSTDDSRFDVRRLADAVFEQGLDDGKAHTLFIDDVQFGWKAAAANPPPAPRRARGSRDKGGRAAFRSEMGAEPKRRCPALQGLPLLGWHHVRPDRDPAGGPRPLCGICGQAGAEGA